MYGMHVYVYINIIYTHIHINVYTCAAASTRLVRHNVDSILCALALGAASEKRRRLDLDNGAAEVLAKGAWGDSIHCYVPCKWQRLTHCSHECNECVAAKTRHTTRHSSRLLRS